jgi:hypothetical protein
LVVFLGQSFEGRSALIVVLSLNFSHLEPW